MNKEDATAALCTAAQKGDVNQVEGFICFITFYKVQRLLKNGTEVNSADYDFRTALHIAASEGYLDIVKLLIDFKANVNAADRWGSTPLQVLPEENNSHLL